MTSARPASEKAAEPAAEPCYRAASGQPPFGALRLTNSTTCVGRACALYSTYSSFFVAIPSPPCPHEHAEIICRASVVQPRLKIEIQRALVCAEYHGCHRVVTFRVDDGGCEERHRLADRPAPAEGGLADQELAPAFRVAHLLPTDAHAPAPAHKRD